jgi:hypothetical protein
MKLRNGLPAGLLSAALLLFTTMAPYTADAQVALQDVHRFVKNGVKHLFTLSYSEGPSAGFSYEGVGFTTYVSALDSDMAPIYRCYNAGHFDHFASTDANCEGYTSEGSYGYVSTVPRAGFTALYRFYNGKRRDHLQTKNYAEVGSNSEWRFESILGYVPN